MALKLLSLNIEREKHLPKLIKLLEKERPEVVCLQEVQEPDFEVLKKKFRYQGFFVPMLTYWRSLDKQKLVRQGIAFYTTLPLLKSESCFYFGEGKAPKYKEQNSIDRVLVLGQVEKEGKKYTIAVTHFTWANDGSTNPEQLRDVQRLLENIKMNGEMILCGDFNSPRGGEIHKRLSKYLKDNIPVQVKTTIDPQLHHAGALQLVVDHLWSTPSYEVRNVKVCSGVSDHQAVIAEIES